MAIGRAISPCLQKDEGHVQIVLRHYVLIEKKLLQAASATTGVRNFRHDRLNLTVSFG
jgi:hypothetical protein